MRLYLKNPLDKDDKAITLTDTDRYVFGKGNRISVVLQLVDRDGNVLDTCKNMFISQDYNGGSLNLDKTWFFTQNTFECFSEKWLYRFKWCYAIF